MFLDIIRPLNTNLKNSDWITLGTANRITAYYRKSAYIVQVQIDGTLMNASLPAWQYFTIGTLPVGCRPSRTIIEANSMATKYDMEIDPDGTVKFVAVSTFNNSNDHVRAHTTFLV